MSSAFKKENIIKFYTRAVTTLHTPNIPASQREMLQLHYLDAFTVNPMAIKTKKRKKNWFQPDRKRFRLSSSLFWFQVHSNTDINLTLTNQNKTSKFHLTIQLKLQICWFKKKQEKCQTKMNLYLQCIQAISKVHPSLSKCSVKQCCKVKLAGSSSSPAILEHSDIKLFD